MKASGNGWMILAITALAWPVTTAGQAGPNARVLQFAQAHLGRQVGNGECWTLAFEALRAAGARHDLAHRYIFGQRVGGQLGPGDIVQFENALFQGRNYWAEMRHHTAIIHSVEAPGVYRLLHCNVGGDRRVQFGRINLFDLRRGTIAAYRPVAQAPPNFSSPWTPARHWRWNLR